jgi:hypothetical protein
LTNQDNIPAIEISNHPESKVHEIFNKLYAEDARHDANWLKIEEDCITALMRIFDIANGSSGQSNNRLLLNFEIEQSMTESSQLSKLASYARKLNRTILKIANERKTIERDMLKLKSRGLIYANQHWRDDRYLYLLYPTKSGERRRREYIGADPERINEARQGVERAKLYDFLSQRLTILDSTVNHVTNMLVSSINDLEQC